MSGSNSLLFRRTLWESRNCWPQLAAILLLSFVAMALQLLLPLPLMIAIDGIAGHASLPRFLQHFLPGLSAASNLGFAIMLMLLTALLLNLQGLGSAWLQTYTGEKLVWDFRSKLLNHVQRLPMSFHDRNGTMDSAYRIQHDAPAIQYVVIQGMVPLVMAVVSIVVMVYVSLRLDAQVSLVALTIIPPLFLLTRGCSRLVRTSSGLVKKFDTSAIGVVQEVLSSIRAVKAFGQEDREYERFVRHSRKRQERQVKLALTQGIFNLFIGIVAAAGSAAALWIGARHVSSGRLSIGELLILIAYIAQLYDPLRLVSNKFSDMHTWAISLERALLLLDEAPEISEIEDPESLVHAHGEIEFCDVSFRYSPQHRGLRNISFCVPAGARVGIMGGSGAGKTTLINLLMRFYDPVEGAVLLDGKDVRKYRIPDLRRQFSVVLQETILFDASLAENIAYGDPDAEDEQIYAAARAANSHEFILQLPAGYQTNIGERGGQLSGGERQRISLARAFLRNSPILVLDEPTSSVDLQTEAAITSALQSLMHGRTTFIIAHRLETLKSCDILLVLSDGELVEIKHGASEEYLASYIKSVSGEADQEKPRPTALATAG
ncbi:MAG TPA: ABC transporter ATP-binding protein [Candidatus Angelobacter sp.]